MNHQRLKIIVLLITILFGCKTKYEKYSYFDNGQVNEKYIFPTKDDKKSMLNYSGILYYENGSIQSKITKKNGHTDGEYLTYYNNGKIRSFTMYNNGTIDGIHRCFSEEGEIVEESLYIKGIHLMKMKAFTSGSETVNFFYYMGNEQEDDIGRIVYKNTGEVDTNESFYYQAFGKDSIAEGDNYNMDIVVYTFNINNYIEEAVFGNFDTSFVVKDSSKFTFMKSADNQLHYSFKPSNTGHNLIIGKIHVKNLPDSKEGLDRDFIFFKEFYVKKNEK